MAAVRVPAKLPVKLTKYTLFEFLLDESGDLLQAYLEDRDQDPPAIELCVQLIEKSLAVATSAFTMPQDPAQSELKAYEARRIRQPLCLALTLLAHLKWDLDLIRNNIPLHLQMAIFEELIKGYNVIQIPDASTFSPNDLDKRTAMVHFVYNRWIVGSITKYIEMKEKDFINATLPPGMKELRDLQEEQILGKLREYLPKALMVLNKASSLSCDLEMPLPIIRMPANKTAGEKSDASSSGDSTAGRIKDAERMEVEDGGSAGGEAGVKKPSVFAELGDPLPLPKLLDVSLPVTAAVVQSQVYYDLGCYYFARGQHFDAWTALTKAHNLVADNELTKKAVNFDKLCGYFLACCNVLRQFAGASLHPPAMVADLNCALEESAKHGYQGVATILHQDNLERTVPFHRRTMIEKELALADRSDLLFAVCTSNFIRAAIEGRCLSNSFLQSLKAAGKDELTLFFSTCGSTWNLLTSQALKDQLTHCVRLAMQFMSGHQITALSKLSDVKIFQEKKSSATKKMKLSWDGPPGALLSSCHQAPLFEIVDYDDRVGKLVRLRADLVNSDDPEKIKDTLFEMHNISPDQSHAKAFLCDMYADVIKEVPDLLMFDTVHVCVSKARQLSERQEYAKALALLTVCVETLDSYTMKASPGAPVGRVKNILHHELLWVELKLAGCGVESVGTSEASRRSKACIQHTQQDPPPRPHIYKAIVVYLLNAREHQFLCDASSNFDIQIVDFLQLAFHLSSVMVGLQRASESPGACKALWDVLLKVVGETNEIPQGPPPSQPIMRARGPAEDQHMCMLKCYVTKEDLVELCTELKDEVLLTVIVSALSSIYNVAKADPESECKDLYSHLWRSSFEGHISAKSGEVFSVLKPICEICLATKNEKSLSWLKTTADLYFAEERYGAAMKFYLEMGSLTTACFSRSVPASVWDDKVYRKMITCSLKEKVFTQAVVLCQFLEPPEYSLAFKAVQERNSEDGMDYYYDCIWDVTLLEYIIFTHSKRGEDEKRKLATKLLSQPELNACNCPDVLRQAAELRKCKFLTTLAKKYWK